MNYTEAEFEAVKADVIKARKAAAARMEAARAKDPSGWAAYDAAKSKGAGK